MAKEPKKTITESLPKKKVIKEIFIEPVPTEDSAVEIVAMKAEREAAMVSGPFAKAKKIKETFLENFLMVNK